VAGSDTYQLTTNGLVPGGYEFNHIPRKSSWHGDRIDKLYNSGLDVTAIKSEATEMYTDLENMDCTINIAKVTVTPIYRPSPSKQNAFKTH